MKTEAVEFRGIKCETVEFKDKTTKQMDSFQRNRVYFEGPDGVPFSLPTRIPKNWDGIKKGSILQVEIDIDDKSIIRECAPVVAFPAPSSSFEPSPLGGGPNNAKKGV